MNTKNFSLFTDHEIKCLGFLPDGEPTVAIIGVHGFAGDKNSSMLSRLAKAVTSRGGALVCFDFPAHGESPCDEKQLTVDNCIADLCCVAEYVKSTCKKASLAVFATSYGGYIALLSSHLLPDCRFVLRAPAVTMPRILLETVLKIEKQTFKNQGTVNCGFERKLCLPYSFSEDLDSREDLSNKALLQPALIIHGSLVDIVPKSDVISYCNSHPDVSLEIIEGADHRFKNKGEIQRVIDLTVDFLF